jgi:predicted nuclease of predicted toxin-antitoxin system
MKFLINMNLPRKLAERLITQGHSCRHVGDIGLAEAEDAEIVAVARNNADVILTHDLDYGNLLLFSGEQSPSAIIFRMRDVSVSSLERSIVDAWPQIESALIEGAVVVLSDATIRIRRLSEST